MLLFIIILGLILGIAEYYSLRYALHRVYYSLKPSRHLIDPDEEFTITTTIENQKRMMVPMVRMSEKFPKDIILQIDGDTISNDRTYTLLNSSFYLMPKQVYIRNVPAHLTKRGCHYFQDAVLRGGDFFGMKETIEYHRCYQEVVVMPRKVNCPELEQTVGEYLGERSVNRFILEDPVLTIGFREYTGREPMRSISWTQSARFGKMMVKNFDHTLDQTVTIILNVEKPVHEQDTLVKIASYKTEETDARVEQCYSLVRMVCEKLEQEQVKYKFVTNAVIASFAGTWSEVSEGLGGNHYQTVMEGLGRATNYAAHGFDKVLAKVYRQSEQGRSFIIVTPQIEDTWQPELMKLQELSGGPVLILTPDMIVEEEEVKTA